MLNWLTYKVLAWIAGALGIVIIGMGVALWAQNVRVGKAQNSRDKAWNEVAKAKETIKGQIALLKECDTATKKLEAEGVKRQIAADAALLRAQQEARRYQESSKRLNALAAAPTPSGAGCAQALGAIRRELRK